MKEIFSTLMVTGGSGFMGSNFIRFWLKNHKQCKVINFDKLTYAGNANSLKDIENVLDYQFIRGDISDFAFVDIIIKNNRSR